MFRGNPLFLAPALGLVAFVLAACGVAATPTATPSPLHTPTPVPSTPTPTPTPTPAPAAESEDAQLWARLSRHAYYNYVWQTDFSKAIVRPQEIQNLSLGRDSIPPIYSPQYVSIKQADSWLSEYEPVALVEVNGEARAYPLQILIWHEVVDDQLGGIPIGVTY